MFNRFLVASTLSLAAIILLSWRLFTSDSCLRKRTVLQGLGRGRRFAFSLEKMLKKVLSKGGELDTIFVTVSWHFVG